MVIIQRAGLVSGSSDYVAISGSTISTGVAVKRQSPGQGYLT